MLLRRSPAILASADSTLLERVAVLRNGGLSQDEVIKVLTVHPQVIPPSLPVSSAMPRSCSYKCGWSRRRTLAAVPVCSETRSASKRVLLLCIDAEGGVVCPGLESADQTQLMCRC